MHNHESPAEFPHAPFFVSIAEVDPFKISLRDFRSHFIKYSLRGIIKQTARIMFCQFLNRIEEKDLGKGIAKV